MSAQRDEETQVMADDIGPSEPGDDDDYTLGGLLRRYAPEAAKMMGPVRAGSTPNPYTDLRQYTEREIEQGNAVAWAIGRLR